VKRLAVVLLLALLVLGASAYTAVDILEGMPHCQDEVAYLFQARILGAGRLYLPSLPEDVRGFFDHEFIVNNGKWYGKYSPGTSALLAAGEAVSAPWAVNPLLGAASVVLVYRLGERLFSWRTGLLTAVAFAVSPFTLLMSASFMSHAPALMATLLFFLGAFAPRQGVTPERLARGYRLAGVGLGLLFLIRPFNVLPVSLIGAVAIVDGLRALRVSRRERLRTLAHLAVPAGVLVLLGLGYNLALTGDPLQFPHQAYSRWDFVGFGRRGVEWGREFTTEDSVENLSENFQALKDRLIAWPGIALLAPAVLAFRGSRRWESLVLGLLFGAQVLAYALYFHPGTYMGPRYWYEVAWAPLMVAAEGVVVLSGWLERRLNRRVVGVILVGAVLTFAGMSLRADWHLLPGYRGYNRMYRPHIPAVNTPALVFVPGQENWQAYGRYFALQSPFLDSQEIVFARHLAKHNVWKDRPPVPNEALTAYFADRHVYRLD
jgi:predicted hotdog family 3-hydroxylacyl-ACP dehydratase